MSKNDIDRIVCSFINLKKSEIERIDCDYNDFYVYLSAIKYECCPICGGIKVYSKGFYKRSIVIPNNALSSYNVHLMVRRYYCIDCHNSFSDKKNLSPVNRKISYSTILNVMEMLKSPRCTFADAAKANGISDSSVVRIFDEHCHVERERFPEVLCIDEVYTKNNDYKAKYSCIFYDFMKQSLVDVTPSRKTDYLHYYLSTISKEERNNVKYVCIDMHLPYKQIVKMYFKKAIICIDSFHVIKTLCDGLKKVRIRITKKYDTDSQEYYLLKNFNYLLMDRSINLDNEPRYNKKLDRYINLNGLLDLILSIDDDLAKAYFLKEKYILFNKDSSYDQAKDKYEDILNEFIASNIKEFKNFITLLKNWKEEILNSFIKYKGRRINNGVAEGINASISTLLFNTRGIRNNRRRRKRILYAINKTGFKLK